MNPKRLLLCAVAAIAATGTGAGAQGPGAIASSFTPGTWMAPNESFAIVLADSALATPGRFAVFIGPVDATALFDAHGDTLTYRSRSITLPAGEHEITVYRVAGRAAWEVVGTIPLRVRNRAGFEKATIEQELVMNSKGTLASGPQAIADVREPFQDVSMTLGLQTTHVRPEWSLRTQSNVMGSSNRQDALRFGERPQDAPKVDLADFLIAADRGSASVSLGHVGFGQHRHLMNGFASRGARASTRLGQKASFAVAALNGSPVVGFSNPTGLSQASHRIIAGSLGLDMLAQPSGLLRVEGTVVDGSLLPLAGFGRGAITDAETSEGGGVRLQAADAGQRFQLDAGYSRSKSDFLADNAMSAGARLAGLTRAARNAWYVDVTADLLRNRMWYRNPLNLAMTVRAERVDPLYRSVAAANRPDVMTRGAAVQGTIGAVSVNATISRLSDNLDRIPSLLTTHTDASSFGFGVPLVSMFAGWLPTLTAAIERTHQFGAGLPPNSGFSATHVPDQVSEVATVGLQWSGARWHADLRINTSDQDNRQAGRENADLLNVANALSIGFMPSNRLSLMFDVGFDGARNVELDQHMRTTRWSAGVQSQPFARTTLNATYAHTGSADEAGLSRQANSDLRVELQQGLSFLRLSARRNPPQVFFRYAMQRSASQGITGDRAWSLSTGLTLPLY